jgi:hypothetical protein
MEFNSDWLTLGRHRVRLRSARGFPTETLRSVAEVARLAIDNNMSEHARLLEIVFQQDHTYDIAVGTTAVEDSVCAPQLEAAMSVLFRLPTEQVNVLVTTVSQEEVDLHFGVYERMLAEKLGVVPPIQ